MKKFSTRRGSRRRRSCRPGRWSSVAVPRQMDGSSRAPSPPSRATTRGNVPWIDGAGARRCGSAANVEGQADSYCGPLGDSPGDASVTRRGGDVQKRWLATTTQRLAGLIRRHQVRWQVCSVLVGRDMGAEPFMVRTTRFRQPRDVVGDDFAARAFESGKLTLPFVDLAVSVGEIEPGGVAVAS